MKRMRKVMTVLACFLVSFLMVGSALAEDDTTNDAWETDGDTM